LLDTARFKYPPHWVDTKMLYSAICTIDSESGVDRGIILATRKASLKERRELSPELSRKPTLP
jgi:hypothetical protein